MIFGADIIYEISNYPYFLKICQENLSPKGSFMIASKAYYYGNDGNIPEFIQFIEQNSQGKLMVRRLHKFGMGSGNRREILSIEWKN